MLSAAGADAGQSQSQSRSLSAGTRRLSRAPAGRRNASAAARAVA